MGTWIFVFSNVVLGANLKSFHIHILQLYFITKKTPQGKQKKTDPDPPDL